MPEPRRPIEGGRALNALAEKPEVKAQLRTRRARELLTQAREDYRTQQYLCCMDRCEVLNASYADLSEAVEAMRLVAEIKNNPDWMRQACESLSDRLGILYLSLAETWIKKGQPHEAVVCLERVIQTLPGTAPGRGCPNTTRPTARAADRPGRFQEAVNPRLASFVLPDLANLCDTLTPGGRKRGRPAESPLTASG